MYNPSNITVKYIDFEQMFKTYNNALCSFAKRFVYQEAEDTVQDIFETMWIKRDTLHIAGKLSLYLYTSVYNKCMKRWKHIKVKENYSKHVQCLYKENKPEHEEKNALFVMVYKEMKSIAEKKIKDLPKQQKEVILMRHKLKLSYKEIAEKLDVSEGTVKTQIHRAMTAILVSFGLNK